MSAVRRCDTHFPHEFSCSTLIEFASEELTDLGRLCIELFDTGQFNSIVNYAAARRSAEPISTAQTESAVHRRQHRRMTAKQQMRWSRRGEHFMPKVRTSVMPGNHGYPDLPVFLAENLKRAIRFLNRNSMWQNNSQSGWPVSGGLRPFRRHKRTAGVRQ
jgi:hypothetical protein